MWSFRLSCEQQVSLVSVVHPGLFPVYSLGWESKHYTLPTFVSIHIAYWTGPCNLQRLKVRPSFRSNSLRCIGCSTAGRRSAEAQGGSFHNGYWRNDANNIFSASTFLKTNTAAATSAIKVGSAVQKSKECGEEFAKIAATALG